MSIRPLNDIRTYFNTQIVEIIPNILPWEEDVFGNNDESKPQAEKFYNLVIGDNTPVREDNTFWDTFAITLDLYTLMDRDYITSFDDAYDQAVNVKNEIIFPPNYNGVIILNDITCTNMSPIEDSTNDNAMKISLNFIVRLNYSLS